MTFTYEDFEKEAQNAGMLNQFSAADLNLAKTNPDAAMTILNYKKDYAAATTEDQRALAKAGADTTRKKYGNYTTGADGSGFYVADDATPSTYTAPEYKSSYSEQIKNLLNTASGDTFSYDADTDPVAQTVKKTYVREGERASKNALGQAAAATGGLPSSAAITAAAQAGQYYGSQLADKTADLEENAYSRFMAKKSADLAILDALESLDTNEYNKYSTDRSFDYGQYLDDIQLKQSEKTTEKTDLENEAALLASAGNFSAYKKLFPDLTDAQISELVSAFKAKKTSSSSSGGGYTGGDDVDDGDGGGGGVTLKDAAEVVNGYIKQGAALADISTQLEAQHDAGTVSDDEYNKYKLIIDAKAADAAHAKAK